MSTTVPTSADISSSHRASRNARPDRTTARLAGILILLATATYMAGSGLLDSVLTLPDYLAQVYPSRGQVVTGVLLEFVNATAIVVVGIVLFRILRRHSETIALGYAATRIIECTLLIVAGISSLLLVPLSQDFVQAGVADTSTLQAVGTLLVDQSALAFQFAMVALGVGSIPFCYLLYRRQLVPRPIAALGLIGYPLLIINGGLEAFDQSVGIVLFLPGALFELLFPIWLIAKGFNPQPGTTPTENVAEPKQPLHPPPASTS